MDKNYIDELYRISINEKDSFDKVQSSLEMKNLTLDREEKKNLFIQVKNADIKTILAIEKNALNIDLDYYANSKSTETSIKEGIEDINRIQKSLDVVTKPDLYKEIDEQYTKKGEREKGLPKDIAYRSFKSHIARLQNPDRMIGISDEEKEIFKVRLDSIKTGFKFYQNMQEKALGIGQEKNTPKKKPFKPTGKYKAKEDIDKDVER